jgi:prepilin-type N-terminal cleavage/methylation domain-containing protein
MRASRRLPGFTLIELLVVVSLLATMLGIGGMILFQMFRVDQSERARVVAASNLERLARAFRADARAANGPADSTDARLVLPMADGRSVEYLVRELDVLRTVRRAGKTEGFEIYRRPPATLARFESTRDGPRPIVAIVFSLDPAAKPKRPGDPAYRDYRIEAAPGRDARLARGVAP